MAIKEIATVTIVTDEKGATELVVTGYPTGCATEKAAESLARAFHAMAHQFVPIKPHGPATPPEGK